MAAVAELEHLCGYKGRHYNNLHYHPIQTDIIVYAAGAAVILEDVNDPHKQEFLRGHDTEICSLDISANGRLIASGQLGSPFRKGAIAPVIIWDYEKRQRYTEFAGLAHSVLCVRFSADGRFLFGSGANQMNYVWDVSTGESIYSRRTETPCFLGVWGPIIEGSQSRYPSYMLCTTYDNQILSHHIDFDIRTMCYVLHTDKLQLPSSGLQRKHICGVVQDDYLITGTAAGDMCVFLLKSKVFRASLPVCNNGVSSMVFSNGILFVGGGDGRVKAVTGSDTHWDVSAENVLEAGVVGLSASQDGAELICGTKNGKIWRLLTSDLQATLHSACHTGEVTSVCFGPASDMVCTTSDSGEMFYMDLSDYSLVTSSTTKVGARCSCVSMEKEEILVGFEDGFVRAWPTTRDSGTVVKWHIPNAHRGAITAVKDSPNFIVTGGADFTVRVWHATKHELLTQFTSHRRSVAALAIDNISPHIIHSGSDDKLVVTYDLKLNKPLVQHVTQNSNVTGLSQRKDREHEVVSSSTDGKVLFWDVDYPDPVGCLQLDHEVRFTCVDVSPEGRYIACGGEDTILYIFDLNTCGCIQECAGHSAAIQSVAWSPDQKQLVSVGKDCCVCIWNFFTE